MRSQQRIDALVLRRVIAEPKSRRDVGVDTDPRPADLRPARLTACLSRRCSATPPSICSTVSGAASGDLSKPRMRRTSGWVSGRRAPRRRRATRCSAPELRVRSQVLVVTSHFAGLDRKTPQRAPHVEHAVMPSMPGCRPTSQRHECSLSGRCGASLAALPLGQVPRTGPSPNHPSGHDRPDVSGCSSEVWHCNRRLTRSAPPRFAASHGGAAELPTDRGQSRLSLRLRLGVPALAAAPAPRRRHLAPAVVRSFVDEPRRTDRPDPCPAATRRRARVPRRRPRPGQVPQSRCRGQSWAPW